VIFDHGKRRIYWLLMFLLVLMANVVGLNSLIAVVGDSYDKVMTERSYYDAKQKFAIVKESMEYNYIAERLVKIIQGKIRIKLFFNRKKTVSTPEFIYIHIMKYSDTSVVTKEWKGKL